MYSADKERRTLWMHVSSLGEFEQGRPIIELWKEQFPDDRIMLSFYSPSGFNIRKNYPLADLVFYLPLDTKKNMNRLLDQIKPDLFVLVKYDFWPNLLRALHKRKIPSYLISARFRPNQYFFRFWGSAFLRQLKVFRWIFVQDEESKKLLEEHHFDRVVVAGDTRVDAVMQEGRKERNKAIGQKGVVIGGSTWQAEEKMLAELWKSDEFKDLRKDWQLVIAPHDISEAHLAAIKNLFGKEMVRLSRCEERMPQVLNQHSIILIDSIGLLSSLYESADIAIIGGGFGKGIHNILEPAAFGLSVVFGPKWTKFREAGSLIEAGAAFPVNDQESFSSTIKKLCSDPLLRSRSGDLALKYMKSQMGSSYLINSYLLGKH